MAANHWVFLSPHLDDAVFSCGGMMWEQSQRGERVEMWTICAGNIPPGPLSSFALSLHERWQGGPQPIAVRQQEDHTAARILGAEVRHFDLPDCIYRHAPGQPEHKLYASEEALFGPLHPLEEALVQQLAARLDQEFPADAQIILPLALGNHVDHQLVRRAGQASRPDGWFYPDFPYAQQHGAAPQPEEKWRPVVWPISEAGLRAWQEATAAYRSQISTFWSGLADVYAAIEQFALDQGGVKLWRRVEQSAAR